MNSHFVELHHNRLLSSPRLNLAPRISYSSLNNPGEHGNSRQPHQGRWQKPAPRAEKVLQHPLGGSFLA